MMEGKTGVKGMWRVRVVYSGRLNLDDISEHMHNHNTPYSTGAIKGILTDMVYCILELTAQGYVVDIDGFARFKAKIKSKGVDNIKDFKVNKDVEQVRLTCFPKQSYRTAWLRGKGKNADTKAVNPIVLTELTQNANVTTE